MINALIEEKENPNPKIETIIDSVTHMSLYASKHFKTEEELMKTHNYPECSSQQEQHKQFREKVITLSNEVVSYKESIPGDFLDKVTIYLRDWWMHHIQSSDMQYKEFFNRKGIH